MTRMYAEDSLSSKGRLALENRNSAKMRVPNYSRYFDGQILGGDYTENSNGELRDFGRN